MATPKKPPAPIKNFASTGTPKTPSGSGTVHPGRTGPRTGSNGNGKTSNGKTGSNWWEGQEHDPMTVSAGLHRLADEIYKPDSTPRSRQTNTKTPPSKTARGNTNTKAQPNLRKTARGH